MKTFSFSVAALVAVASASSLEKCGAVVTGVLTTAATNSDSVACHKETGISTSATTVSDEDVKKALASKACNTWWKGIVKEINSIEPACKFPLFDGSGKHVNTDKFHMKYTEFLHVTQKALRKAGNGTITAVASPESLEQCGTTVSTILTESATNHGAKACSTETGIPLTATSISGEDLAKVLKAKTCREWWAKIVTDIKAVKPACDFHSLDGSGKALDTGSFSLKFEEFLELGKKLAGDRPTSKGAPKKGTEATSMATPATTATTDAPKTTTKSNAIVASLSVTAIVVVAAFA
ncbi:hypothetical protein DYB32_001614 [Aphanomyces invadans]|uniref:Uncharacterized protein n=1 Tax=Aphanomyces invadans TaxID=157072 RepID=A0A418B5T5_9STRA|nr:hypothetical protein DYB32_001614 [Aphanomyces invadans]